MHGTFAHRKLASPPTSASYPDIQHSVKIKGVNPTGSVLYIFVVDSTSVWAAVSCGKTIGTSEADDPDQEFIWPGRSAGKQRGRSVARSVM